MDYKKLVEYFNQTQAVFQAKAVVAINQSLILRNWLFGFYIVEYEQNGKDYAKHGERLLYNLADELKRQGIKGVSYTNLTLFRKFYLGYPQFSLLIKDIPELNLLNANLQALPEDFKTELLAPHELLSTLLSFTHFVELLKIDDPHQRLFYEIESIKGSWSYRQLHRQIATSLYERTGLSVDKQTLLKQIQGEQKFAPSELIRDPYVFEFLGLKMREVFREKDLEKALLDHLQDFLLELGTGFCFEARQKTFLIDNRRYKIDLLFYHRILKCHVLIDLKMDEFTHEDAGQMNFYLNYFRSHEMQDTDNPPVGIILCSLKNEAVVKYATGGLDNRLFVSRYLLQLPSEEQLKHFLIEEKKKLK